MNTRFASSSMPATTAQLRVAAGYASAGLAGTLCHYLLLVASVSVFGLRVLPATGMGALAGMLVNYGLNRRLVFFSTRRHRETLPRFIAVAMACLLVNLLVVALLTQVPGLHYLLAQFAATGCVLAAGFFLNRRWTFAS